MESDLSLEWLRAGFALDAAQARELEARLAVDPDDFEARVMLLGHASSRQPAESVESDTFREHLLWCIAQRPRADVHIAGLLTTCRNASLLAAACEQWSTVLAENPDDVSVLTHAGLAFFSASEMELALSKFERLEHLEPTNPAWPEWRSRCLRRLGDNAEHDERALAAVERALALQQPRAAHTVSDAAELAWKLQRSEQARELALELLELARTRDLSWMLGNAQYDGHRILGLIALAHGDLATAERELLESGRTVGSPQLNSFGPELDLANALLERGRTEAVIEFLELCTRFWKPRPLQRWIAAIRAGEKPELNHFLGMRYDYEARETEGE